MKDYVKEIKMVENGLVLILLFIVIAILTDSLIKIIDRTMKISAETYTINNIEIAKEIYTINSLTYELPLPFKIVYKNKGYELYSNGKKISKTKNVINEKEKLPKSGSITFKSNGDIIVKDLEFGLYKCNLENNKQVICEK